MQVLIRQIRQSDITELTEIFNHQSVVRNISQLPYGTDEQWQSRLHSGDGCMTLVAELNGSAIGCITLVTEHALRRKHVASLAMAVNPHYHNQGVGTQLLESAMSLADDWMNVARVELGVFTSNRGAIKLYHHFGFAIEGEARAYAYGEGKYQNLLYMARVRKSRRAKKPAQDSKDSARPRSAEKA